MLELFDRTELLNLKQRMSIAQPGRYCFMSAHVWVVAEDCELLRYYFHLLL